MKKYWWHHSKSNSIIFSFAVAVVLISVAFLSAYFFGGSSKVPAVISGKPLTVGPAGIPERLIIPSVGVDALVQTVGLDSAGRMGIPTNFTDVAWFKDGPRPGDKGSSVIDGHLDNARDASAVFKDLAGIKIGDDIYVLDKAVQKIHFRVIGKEIYNFNDAPVEKIFDQSGNTSRLNLITCDGVWNQATKNYSERLVVYSERVLD